MNPRWGCLLAWTMLCALSLGGCRSWSGERAELPTLDQGLRTGTAELLAQAIRFDTVNPPGNEKPLAAYLVEVARSAGLEARVVDTPGRAEPGRAAAWALLPGSGARRPVILHSHLDVVPADREQWAVEPFGGIVGGGFVVGRGALDAKGVAVVHLLALAELRRRGVELDRDVIFLSTPDEEMGGLHGSGVIVRDHPELLRNAEFLLTEGGGILPGRADGADVWGVTFTEKIPCWLELRTYGLPGHGASASAEGAVPRLVRALERVRRFEPEVRVVPEVARMFRALAPLAVPWEQLRFENLEEALRVDPVFRERFLSENGQAALVRDTVAITVLEGSDRTNIVPAVARAQLDIRLLPGSSCPGFVAHMREVIDDDSVELQTLLTFEGNASPIRTELFRAIERVAARLDPAAVVVPRMITGFTDAHYYREHGITAYGFVPRRLRPVDTRGIHGPNERISIENLELGVRGTVELLMELGGAAERR